MFFSEIFRGILRRLLGITGTPLGLYSDTFESLLRCLRVSTPIPVERHSNALRNDTLKVVPTFSSLSTSIVPPC